jgi:cyclic pyranopterin phosphate synthase
MNNMLEMGFKVKLNAVAMKNRNIDDIIPLINLTKNNNIDVRFIEEMPFNGDDGQTNEGFWSFQDLLFYISEHFPDIISFPMKAGATAMEYQVPGHRGKIGIIAAYSRTFCGTCNRIRVTPLGILKTCLYDNGIFNIKDIMRQGANDKVIIATLKEALAHRAKDGHEAEKDRGRFPTFGESMASIGG